MNSGRPRICAAAAHDAITFLSVHGANDDVKILPCKYLKHSSEANLEIILDNCTNLFLWRLKYQATKVQLCMLTEDVHSGAAVAVAARGLTAGEVDSIGRRVCLGECANVVVVARVRQGVTEHKVSRHQSLRHSCRRHQQPYTECEEDDGARLRPLHLSCHTTPRHIIMRNLFHRHIHLSIYLSISFLRPQKLCKFHGLGMNYLGLEQG